MGPTRAGAPFVGVRGSLMLTTARSVPSARKMYVLTLQHGMELFHCITVFNCGGVTVNMGSCAKGSFVSRISVCYTSFVSMVFSFFPILPQRDGCPKIVNLGSSKTDLFYERKKYGFKKR